MFRLLKKLHASKLVIPVTRANLPVWLWYTMQDRRSHKSELGGRECKSNSPFFAKPNLDSAIFIIGAPRSGTTFLGRSLSVLPEISYHHEPVLTKAATRYIYQGSWPHSRAARIFRFTYGCLMRMHGEQKLRFCEKTPSNGLIVPFLERTFSNAKFIHIKRDGRDVALSLSRKPWYVEASRDSSRRDADGYRVGPWARYYIEPERQSEYEQCDDLPRCIWLWRRYVEEIQAGLTQVPSSRKLEISYESLVHQPASVATELLNFLDISDSDSRNLYGDFVEKHARKDSVGAWKSVISEEQLQLMFNESAVLLKDLGYE